MRACSGESTAGGCYPNVSVMTEGCEVDVGDSGKWKEVKAHSARGLAGGEEASDALSVSEYDAWLWVSVDIELRTGWDSMR